MINNPENWSNAYHLNFKSILEQILLLIREIPLKSHFSFARELGLKAEPKHAHFAQRKQQYLVKNPHKCEEYIETAQKEPKSNLGGQQC